MAKNSCQKKPKFLEILGTKVVQFWCYTKLIKTKKLLLNWYFSTKIFLERFEGFLMLKIDFENQILALFDVYFWPFNKSHEKINIIFVISAIIASIWNVFIKFQHDEKLKIVPHLVLSSITMAGLGYFCSKLICTLWQENCRFWYWLVLQSDFMTKSSRTMSDFGMWVGWLSATKVAM